MLFWNFLIIFFGILLLFFSFFNLKKGDFTINEYLFWSFFSITIIIFGFKPEFLLFFSKLFNFYRILDFITVFGFMFFTIAIIYLYKQNRRLEKKFNNLIVKIALENKKDKRK